MQEAVVGRQVLRQQETVDEDDEVKGRTGWRNTTHVLFDMPLKESNKDSYISSLGVLFEILKDSGG